MSKTTDHYRRPPASCVIFVLLDGFRHDYVHRTHFLRSLAKKSLVGRLEEPFGFCPRGAYFSGLSVSEQGYSHLFHFDPEESPFRWTRFAWGTGSDSWVRATLRNQIRQNASRTLPPFSAAYIDPVDIPLEMLAYFDLSEKEPPWSSRYPHPSLFHWLDATRRPWLEVSWPFAGFKEKLNDTVVTERALAELDSHHAFAYIHLPSLDAAGHIFGPGSAGLQRELEQTDAMCRKVAARASELFEDPILVFAGDHGMIPVLRAVDPQHAFFQSGLRPGVDFVYFVDSTMVRCWFFSNAARRKAISALAAVGGGHWISNDEASAWEIASLDRKNADATFLADPGVVFSPSFFDSRKGSIPRGMHGYSPELVDNQAILMVHRPRNPEPGRLGTVKAKRLYPSFLQWLGCDPATQTPVTPISPSSICPYKPRWSIDGDPHSDSLVDTHFSVATTAIRERCAGAKALIVTGGFGRGEGSLIKNDAGYRPLNDYDFTILGAKKSELAGLESSLKDNFNIDFVDFVATDGIRLDSRVTIADYDLRYGSSVFWGDSAVIENLRLAAPGEIPRSEGSILIGNRIGGILLALTGWKDQYTIAPGFNERQFSKFLIALADRCLLEAGDYHASYVTRRTRFQTLVPAWSLSEATCTAIIAAFDYKLSPSQADFSSHACVQQAQIHLDEIARCLRWPDLRNSLLSEISDALPYHTYPHGYWLKAAEELSFIPKRPPGEDSYRLILDIYAALLESFLNWHNSDDFRNHRIMEILSANWVVGNDNQEPVARRLAKCWLSLFH